MKTKMNSKSAYQVSGTLHGLVRWGALWHQNNKLEGLDEHLLCENCVPVLFVTRRECRAWIALRYGYIAERRSLREEPHGWKMPIPVRVTVTPNMPHHAESDSGRTIA